MLCFFKIVLLCGVLLIDNEILAPGSANPEDCKLFVGNLSYEASALVYSLSSPLLVLLLL